MIKVKTKSRIHFINTGSSDAILIESNGHYGLVDSGNPYDDGNPWATSIANNSVEHVIGYLDNLGVTKLDFIVATHPHADHIGGIPKIASKYVDSNTSFYYRTYNDAIDDADDNSWDSRNNYFNMMRTMKSAGAVMYEVTNKEPIITLGDFSIQLINTEVARENEKEDGFITDGNKDSIVEYITYKGKYKTLLAADMEREDEPYIANKIGHVEVLKVGHHSYASATSFGFVDKISPKYAVITNIEMQPSFFPIAYYMQEAFGTNFYVTGNSKDAVVFEYNDNGYTVDSNKALVKMNVTDRYHDWIKINGQTWMIYRNGKPIYSSWYQDSDGRKFYLDYIGAPATGWRRLQWGNTIKYFHFNEDGSMDKSGCKTIKNVKYCFDENGVCISGGNCK